jgi:hypothetical protein
MGELIDVLAGIDLVTMVSAAEGVVSKSEDLNQARSMVAQANERLRVLSQLPGLLNVLYKESQPKMSEPERMAIVSGATAVILTLCEIEDLTQFHSQVPDTQQE